MSWYPCQGRTFLGMSTTKTALAAVTVAVLAGCGQQPLKPGDSHIREQAAVEGTIPPPVQVTPLLPQPKPSVRPETYSVVVNNVRVQELLFALARDARLNVDIHPDMTGTVTLNAIDQTLPQLLTRISRQVDMRYEIDGANLVVMRDTPFLRVYRIDYVNMTRDSRSIATVSTQVTGGLVGQGGERAEQFHRHHQLGLGQQVLGHAGREHQGDPAGDRQGDSRRRRRRRRLRPRPRRRRPAPRLRRSARPARRRRRPPPSARRPRSSPTRRPASSTSAPPRASTRRCRSFSTTS